VGAFFGFDLALCSRAALQTYDAGASNDEAEHVRRPIVSKSAADEFLARKCNRFKVFGKRKTGLSAGSEQRTPAPEAIFS
jgi:hypothetical protein